MYFTPHRVHLTNKSLAIGLNCEKNVHGNIWRSLYLYPVRNDCCLFSVSHLKREFRFLKRLICKILSPVSPSEKLKHSDNWGVRFTLLFFWRVALLYDFSFIISKQLQLPEHSRSYNQNNKQGLFRWMERLSIQ